jgi:hypothetical protein
MIMKIGVAAIAALIASPALATVGCDLTTVKGDRISYTFEQTDANNYVETRYSKNGWVAPDRRPLWQRVNNGWGLVPYETPDFALQFQATGTPNILTAQLTHLGRVGATGTCVKSASYQPGPVSQPAAPYAPPAIASGPIVVPVMVLDGGNLIKVGITDPRRGATWTAVLDTGAALVAVPTVDAETLVAAGEAHWTGETRELGVADGRNFISRLIVIHRLTIGSTTLNNVTAATTAGGPMLIGMSALSRLGPMKLDVARGTVTFG